MYEVECFDGIVATLAANVISNNILSQVDEGGHRQLLMDDIIDHCSNKDAIKEVDAFYTTRSGTKRRWQTIKGWKICVK